MTIDLGSFVSSPLFGLVLAPLVAKSVDFLKQRIGTLETSSALVKQATALVVSVAGVMTGHVVAGVSPDSAGAAVQSMLTPENAMAVITAALGAIAVKHGQKNDSQSSKVGDSNEASTSTAAKL